MQKTIIKNICDDCLREVDKFAARIKDSDLCLKCVCRRVEYSISVLPVGAKCPWCQGKGYTKECDGYNGTVSEDCERCDKTGQAQFKR